MLTSFQKTANDETLLETRSKLGVSVCLHIFVVFKNETATN